MIDLVDGSGDGAAREIVARALERSFTRGQVRVVDRIARDTAVAVLLAPDDSHAEAVSELMRRRAKILLLGRIGPAVASLAGISLEAPAADITGAARCAPAASHGASESAAAVAYADAGPGATSPLRRRPLCRFDFTDEWNNLGFGRIGFGEEPFDLPALARCGEARPLAMLVTGDGDGTTAHGAVATLRETPTASIAWMARPVGPVDGPDWRIVESFIADHRAGELPCRPYLCDIPFGFAAAVTMRIDCDEAIASGADLFALYRGRGLPFSLAVKTGQDAGPEDIGLMRDVLAAGGAVLSHSQSHAPGWGGSPDAARHEARSSRQWLEERLPGHAIRHAVSPFHQTPAFVPPVLAQEGYGGFIGGSISTEPQFLLARGGAIPHGPPGFVSHSQSCMLHGDCLRADGDPLRVYRQAFRLARQGGQFFGYLDHPFSDRYAYGWSSEAERLRMHAALLDVIDAECARDGRPLLFASADTCLGFMRDKADTVIHYDAARERFAVSQASAAGLPLAIGHRGGITAASAG